MKSKEFTYKQLLATDKGISRVRDKENMMGAIIPGCTFPSNIMFLNAYNQNFIKGLVKAIIEGAKPILDKFKDSKGEWKKDGLANFLKEEDEYLKKVEKGVALRTYSMKELSKIDDEYYQKANENTPVPQEYISLLMEADLIEDDLE